MQSGWKPFLASMLLVFLFASQKGMVTHALTANSSLSRRVGRSQQQDVHLIILVHGWMGNPEEMSYLASALDQQAASLRQQRRDNGDNRDPQIVVHSAECNRDRTHDGVEAGGSRLADEVNGMLNEIRAKNQTASLSFVGNSLGGLYSRYALSKIDFGTNSHNHEDEDTCDASWSVRPAVFCTTATPHLGVSRHTYIPLPRAAEYLVAQTMLPTGRDLFRFTNVIQELTLSPAFVSPLLQFEQRLAHANAHQTDFQVPTSTAAFVDPNLHSLHHVPAHSTPSLEDTRARQFWRLTVDTAMQAQPPASSATNDDNDDSSSTTINSTVMAERLDAMGWRKIFWDVRDTIPSIPLPFWFGGKQGKEPSSSSSSYTSSELYRQFTTTDRLLLLPMGHTMLCANSKSKWYARINAGGQPVMDWVAKDLLQYILWK